METRIIQVEKVTEYNIIYDGGYSYSIEWLPSEPWVGKQYRLTTKDAGTRIVSIEDV